MSDQTLKLAAAAPDDLQNFTGETKSKAVRAPKADRFLELEAYRGLAAVLVISFHCYQHAGAAAAGIYRDSPVQAMLRVMDGALALFFVLSGFINFLPFARSAIDQSRPHSARGFM